MKLVEWVDLVKATGGVPDSGHDTLAAMRASTLCWAEIDRKGEPRSEIAQRGIEAARNSGVLAQIPDRSRRHATAAVRCRPAGRWRALDGRALRSRQGPWRLTAPRRGAASGG